MKLSFSTAACPELSLDRIIMKAKTLRFDGIEIEGIGNETYLPKISDFSDSNLQNTMKLISANELEIPILSSYSLLSDVKNKVQLMQEPYDCIDLAEKANINFIRVFGDKNIEPSINDNLDIFFVMENLKQICSYAKPKGITVLIETNGIFSDSRILARMLRELDCKNAGVLWNVNHTVRYSFETPSQTVTIFGNKLKHVHINDTLQKKDVLEYKPLGRGDLPLEETINALKKSDFNGHISLYWPKRTNPELLDADTILPQYLYYIKNLME